jgi:hypothetical protein
MNRLAFMERLAVPAIAAPVLRGARSKQEPMAWYCSLPGGAYRLGQSLCLRSSSTQHA